MLKRSIALLIIFCLVFEQSGFAQVAPQMQVPVYLTGLLNADRYRPMHLRALSFDETTKKFLLQLDQGSVKQPAGPEIEATTKKLMKYFQIGLRLPNSMLWVNLRPDNADSIIDPYLGRTDMGKVLLAADVQLKKDLARFTAPGTPEGREYWNKLYQKAERLYGDHDVEIPTITRPWIVPGEIVVRQHNNSVYVHKAVMRVMLEEDWIKAYGNGVAAAGSPAAGSDPRIRELNAYSTQLLKECIIPKLTREVNSARSYSELRQVFYSLVLAQWFKARSSADRGFQADGSRIDTKDLSGLVSKTAWSKEEYFRDYKKSFEQGEYNEEEKFASRDGVVIRRYVSGGVRFGDIPLGTGISAGTEVLERGNSIEYDPDTMSVSGNLKGGLTKTTGFVGQNQQRPSQVANDGGTDEDAYMAEAYEALFITPPQNWHLRNIQTETRVPFLEALIIQADKRIANENSSKWRWYRRALMVFIPSSMVSTLYPMSLMNLPHQDPIGQFLLGIIFSGVWFLNGLILIPLYFQMGKWASVNDIKALAQIRLKELGQYDEARFGAQQPFSPEFFNPDPPTEHTDIYDGGSRDQVTPLKEQGSANTVSDNGNEVDASAARVDSGETVGGVDFRSIPVNAQAITASPEIVPVKPVSLDIIDTQWRTIQRNVRGGSVPYDQLKDYVAACKSNKEARGRLSAAMAYVNDIMRMEEDAAVPSSNEMLQVLAIIG